MNLIALKAILGWVALVSGVILAFCMAVGLFYVAAGLWAVCSPLAVFVGLAAFFLGVCAIGFFLDVCC